MTICLDFECLDFGQLLYCFLLLLQTYLKFLKQSKPGRLVIVTDPPFGGRCELVANTYKSIQKDFAHAHENVDPEKCRVEMVWIFPYFMEHQVTIYSHRMYT